MMGEPGKYCPCDSCNLKFYKSASLIIITAAKVLYSAASILTRMRMRIMSKKMERMSMMMIRK